MTHLQTMKESNILLKIGKTQFLLCFNYEVERDLTSNRSYFEKSPCYWIFYSPIFVSIWSNIYLGRPFLFFFIEYIGHSFIHCETKILNSLINHKVIIVHLFYLQKFGKFGKWITYQKEIPTKMIFTSLLHKIRNTIFTLQFSFCHTYYT